MEPLFWPKAGQIPVRNLRRQLKHTRLFWREVGRGQTVVFLHGSWEDGDQWSDVLSLLGSDYHCLAPDMVGFGESERLSDPAAYSIAMEVNTLTELLESLRLKSIVLVGHSLGAWVAVRYALRHPDQVKGLCVLEPEGVIYEPQRWRRERWLISPLSGLWLTLTGLVARRSAPHRRSAWLQKHHLRTLLKRHRASCRLLFQRRQKAIEPELVGPQLASLSIPMALLYRETDDTTGQRLARSFTMAAPNTMAKVLPGSGDLPNHEAGAIAGFLKDWLTQHIQTQ